MAFFLDSYRCLLATLSAHRTMTVLDYLVTPSDRGVILRHDVDRMPGRAVSMARLEAEMEIRSSYYFRSPVVGCFPQVAVETIAALGHEVGYHYECLSACRGDKQAALEQFSKNLTALRRLAPCHTVAMHGAPLSPHRNEELLFGQDLARFELVGDASLSFVDIPLVYFTDTGGRWDAGSTTNFRDRVGIPQTKGPAPDDRAFCTWLGGYNGLVYISTHPERWPTGLLGFMGTQAQDIAINLAKRGIAAWRRA